jgi:hypothetical protein
VSVDELVATLSRLSASDPRIGPREVWIHAETVGWTPIHQITTSGDDVMLTGGLQ